MPWIVLITVLGAWAGFANPVMHAPLAALLLPAGLFLLALRAQRPGLAFKHGLVTGLLAYLGCMYWVALPVHNYGGLPWALALPCPVLVAAYLGLYAGLFCLGCRLWRDRLDWLPLALFAGLLWALLEALRGWIFTGFPWLALPSALAPMPMMLQGLSVVGAYGLSAVLVAAACCVALAVARGRPVLLPLLTGLAVLICLFLFGLHQLSRPLDDTGRLRVALVQANIDQSVKWDPTFQRKTVERYATLSEGIVAERGSELVIWPETALPFYYQEDSELAQAVRRTVFRLGVPLLTGAPGYESQAGPEDYVLYNRAYLLAPSGETAGIYEKEHLVPFGEYVPLGSLFPFIDTLVEAVGDFSPGRHTGPLEHGRLALGVLICYETIFQELAHKRTAEGANLLVNISNDAWFGHSSAPLQHLHLSLLRAVEQGRFLVRATNTGISAIVDPRGRVVLQSDLFRAQTIGHEVGLMSRPTVFHRARPFILPAMAGGLLVLCAIAFLRPRRQP